MGIIGVGTVTLSLSKDDRSTPKCWRTITRSWSDSPESMDRNRLIAVLLAIGGIVAIVFLSKRFVVSPASPFTRIEEQSVSSQQNESEFAVVNETASAASASFQGASISGNPPVSSSADLTETRVPIVPAYPSLGSMRMPEDASYSFNSGSIFVPLPTDKAPYSIMVRIDGTYTFQGREAAVQIFFKPKPGVTQDQLSQMYSAFSSVQASTEFGTGNVEDAFANTPPSDIPSFETEQGLKGHEFILALNERNYFRDVDGYVLDQIPLETFSSVMITFLNAWPQSSALPSSFGTEFVNRLQQEDDPRADLYTALDQSVHSFAF